MPLSRLQIKPHQISPLLATPRTLALTFAGAASYIAFVDPHVRNELEGTKNKLQHWATMYSKSIAPMSGLALLSGIFAALSYFKTKEKLWILGGTLMAGLWPFTYFFMMSKNNELNRLNATLKTEREIASSGVKENILDLMSSWLTRHKIRAFTALAAALVFYAAEINSTQNVNVAVNIK